VPTDPPERGRTFRATRPVRLSDVTPKGRCRVDAIARYLQDIGNDDAVDGIGRDAAAWVVRRTTLHVERFPVFRERLDLTTWASGVGSRWAERSTAITGSEGGAVQATALWVHVDLETGRPKRLPPDFDRVYGEAAAGRTVTARLDHGDPPATGEPIPWPARFSDFDVLGHVNNAVYWAVVEEHLDLQAPVTVVLEYRGGIDRGQTAEVVVDGDSLWILADGSVAASARITPERL
jgi:acyl-ACP thioesterase